jgi:hypothetical protein
MADSTKKIHLLRNGDIYTSLDDAKSHINTYVTETKKDENLDGVLILGRYSYNNNTETVIGIVYGSGATAHITYLDAASIENSIETLKNEISSGLSTSDKFHVETKSDGFYIIDSEYNVGLQYTENGLDAALITDHFKELVADNNKLEAVSIGDETEYDDLFIKASENCIGEVTSNNEISLNTSSLSSGEYTISFADSEGNELTSWMDIAKFTI